ncbi:MAG: head-tail connector protein [Clostridia bacterium]|nr:DNA-packaging protein [Clostridia bacterium]MBR5281123.1 head-tail connector protein [Clostridia bacterium]
MLEAVKLALRIVTNAYDDELQALIMAAIADLGIVLNDPDESDALITQAIKTYVRMNFGSPSDYDRLKRSYDEQKAQLASASGYGLS